MYVNYLCYKVTKLNENEAAYLALSFDSKKSIPKDKYNKIHQSTALDYVADTLRVDRKMVIPVTYKEYVENTAGGR